MLDNTIGFHPGLSSLILRLVLGYIFIVHGYRKLFKKEFGLQGFALSLNEVGSPVPSTLAPIIGSLEFLGGLFLIAGVFTRIVALALATNTVIAVWKSKLKTGLVLKVTEGATVGGYEFELALCAMTLVLALISAGRFSIDYFLLTR